MFRDMQTQRLTGRLYRRHFLFPKLKQHISGKLIDIGAGLGDFCVYYKNSVAADINKHAVNHCRNRSVEATLIVNNKITCRKESFDSVLMDNVLEHIEKPEKLIFEVHRLLKSQGSLIVGVPGIKGFKLDFDHKVFYTDTKLINLIEGYKFKFIKKFYTPIPIKSEFVSKNLKSYCVYCIFYKI